MRPDERNNVVQLGGLHLGNFSPINIPAPTAGMGQAGDDVAVYGTNASQTRSSNVTETDTAYRGYERPYSLF